MSDLIGEIICIKFKGIVYTAMKIWSYFTQPFVILNLYDFLSSV